MLTKTDIEYGGIAELGKNALVDGNVRAESSVRLSLGATIYALVEARGAYVSWDADA